MVEFDPPKTSSTLETVDALAHVLIARAAPIRFCLARSPQEREAVYRMRYRVVIERGWACPEDLQDGLERDAYDDIAVHVVGWDGETLAASARLVIPRPGHRLPTEEAFGVTIEPHEQTADLSREIVARSYSSTSHRVFAGLIARCWLELRARGFCCICGDFTPSMVRLYRRMGFQVRVLGPGREFWGKERQPVLCDPGSHVARLLSRLGGQYSTAV